MKKYTYLLILLLTITYSFSQDVTKIDNLKYKCKYLLAYQSDSTDLNSVRSEKMLLLIGNKTSKFISLGSFLRDSILNNTDKERIKSIGVLNMFNGIPKPKFIGKIFKNYPQGKITSTEQISKDFYKYQEPLNLFNWTITNETKTVSGYHCQKATTTFSGRDYIAWFTNEIPIPDGPYKFNGLPGLIVQIKDSKNHYEYKLISLIKSNGEIGINNGKNYIETTKKEFKNTKKVFYSNIFNKLEQSGFTVTSMNSSQKRNMQKRINKKNNNSIELDNK